MWAHTRWTKNVFILPLFSTSNCTFQGMFGESWTP
jgi:hypothetical protein